MPKMEDAKIDFTKIYEGLISEIQESNRNITHKEFAEGAKNGTMGFKVMFGEPAELSGVSGKIIFSALVSLYLWIPFVIVPLFAYSVGNWWLLVGSVLSPLFAHFAAWKKAKSKGKWKANIIIYFGLFAIGYWFNNGFHFHDLITFYFFCSLWGHMLFLTADRVQFNYAIKTLVENEDIFNAAIANSKIMIIHKDKEDKIKTDEINQGQASVSLDRGDEKYFMDDFNGAIIEYTKAIEKYPFVTAFEKRGNAKMKTKDYQGAIVDYSEAIVRMPANPNKNIFADIYTNRGEAKRVLGFTNEAELDLIEANKLRIK